MGAEQGSRGRAQAALGRARRGNPAPRVPPPDGAAVHPRAAGPHSTGTPTRRLAPSHPYGIIDAMTDSPCPEVIPVFPLTGVVLLPGNWLPLNVFEPRYRALVEDALAGGRHIGMIQPLAPQADNAPDPEAPPPDDPEIYPVGCAGRIERSERQADGRFVILLRGVSRFRVREELPPERGYRRVVAGYDEFAADRRETEVHVDPEPVMEAVRRFSRAQGTEIDFDKLSGLPGRALVNGLAVAMPFSPAEKQALLEAPGPAARRTMLLSLLEMGLRGGFAEDLDEPPPAN
jgi:uncharacterized protein